MPEADSGSGQNVGADSSIDSNWVSLEIVDSLWRGEDGDYEVYSVARNNTDQWLYQPMFSIDYGQYGVTHGIGLAEIVPPFSYVPYDGILDTEDVGQNWNGSFTVLEAEALKMDGGQEEITGAYPYLLVESIYVNPEDPSELCWQVRNVGDEEYIPAESWGMDIHYMFFSVSDDLIGVGRVDALHRLGVQPEEMVEGCGFAWDLDQGVLPDRIEAVVMGYVD